MEKGKVVLVVIIIFALDCGFTQKQNLKTDTYDPGKIHAANNYRFCDN